MGLTQIPTETLWAITSYLPRQRDIHTLIKTNRHVYNVLRESLYHFNSQYHHGAALSFASERKNVPQITSLLDGFRVARNKARSPPRDLDAEESEEDEECPEDRDTILHPYWTDILTHPLYHQGYSILDIVNIQRALLVAIRRGYTDIVTLLLDRGARVNFYRAQPPAAFSRRAVWVSGGG